MHRCLVFANFEHARELESKKNEKAKNNRYYFHLNNLLYAYHNSDVSLYK